MTSTKTGCGHVLTKVLITAVFATAIAMAVLYSQLNRFSPHLAREISAAEFNDIFSLTADNFFQYCGTADGYDYFYGGKAILNKTIKIREGELCIDRFALGADEPYKVSYGIFNQGDCGGAHR